MHGRRSIVHVPPGPRLVAATAGRLELVGDGRTVLVPLDGGPNEVLRPAATLSPPAPEDERMNLDEVGALALGHTGVRRKGTEARPAWYVEDRLVVRWLDPTSVVVRSGLAEREELLAAHPATFSVPPRFERHEMVVVELPGADPAAVADAIARAVERQRR